MCHIRNLEFSYTGWTCTSVLGGVTDKLVYSRLEPHEDTVRATYSSITYMILPGSCPCLTIESQLLSKFGDRLFTVSAIVEVISFLNSCISERKSPP